MDAHGREVFRDYVAQRYPQLLRTAYLLTGNKADAEDLLQGALASTWLAWDRIRERDALDAYVRRSMVNQRTSLWRRKKIDERPIDDLSDTAGSTDHVQDIAEHDAMWRAICELPRKQRAILVLRYYEDLSEAETAAALGISVGTVKSATSRALERLRSNNYFEPSTNGAL